jgi:hypothetical protein
MKMVAEKKAKGEGESKKEKEETKLAPSVNPISQKDVTSILKVPEDKKSDEEKEQEKDSESGESSSQTKSVTFKGSDQETSSGETKKIKL